MAAPCALITSCSDFNPQNIVKHILNVSELPKGQAVVESVMSYDWHIDTKYYTADVQLCTTNARTIGDENFADSVQAFVAYFDSQEESSFQKVSAWLPYLAHINPAVQILVCQTCRQGDAVSRQTTLEWCIKNGFELVELEPEENSDDEDDDFKETTGAKRIVQALHAHTWPNLTLKSRSPVCSPYFRNLMQEEAALKSHSGAVKGSDERSDSSVASSDVAATPAPSDSSMAAEPAAARTADENAEKAAGVGGAEGGKGDKPPGDESGDASQTSSTAASKKPFEGLVPDDNEMAILAALGDEDPDDESFEQMFARLQVMKEKASSLPPEERKSYAEQIAVTFWRAIGGDEAEIEGLFDNLDDVDPSET